MFDIAVVGGGCCGLACALAMARHGHRVCVVERRADPATRTGKQDFQRTKRLLAEADACASDAEAGSLLQKARRIQARYWGVEGRNVILDSHTVAYLQDLGVDTQALPQVKRFTLDGPPGGPTFAAHLALRDITGERQGLTPLRMLWQRDWTVLAPLATIEEVLREQCQAQGIEIRFGVEVTDISESANGTTIRSDVHTGRPDEDSSITAGFVVVADGNGRHSLTHRLGIPRTVHHHEMLSLAVVFTQPDEYFHDTKATSVFTTNQLTDDGWFGVFGNGQAVSGVVNATGMNSHQPQSALDALRNAGLNGPLAEAPLVVRAEIAEVTQCSRGRHVVIVGDAALSGNPRIGLGVQFGLLWAQMLERHVLSVHGRLQVSDTFDAAASVVRDKRRNFELAWTHIIDTSIEQPARLADYAASDSLLGTLRDVRLSMQRKPSGRLQCNFSLSLNPELLADHDHSAVAEFLRAMQGVEITGKLSLKPRISRKGQLRLRARLSPRRPLRLAFGGERLLLNDGQFELRRQPDEWQLRLRKVTTQQTSNGKLRSTFPLDSTRLSLPDGFVEQVMGHTFDRASQAGVLPFEMCTLIPDNHQITLGSLQLQTRGEVTAVTTAQMQRELVVRYTLVEGSLEPLDLVAFASQSNMASARWLGALSQLTCGLADPWINSAAKIAGNVVTGIELRMHANGSAIVSLEGPMPLSFGVDKAEAARLRADLLNVTAQAELMASQIGRIQRLDICAPGKSDKVITSQRREQPASWAWTI